MTGAVRVVVGDNEKRHFTKADMERQLRLGEVNHCLSFEQVSDELIEDYNISDGIFDTGCGIPLHGTFFHIYRQAVSGVGAVYDGE